MSFRRVSNPGPMWRSKVSGLAPPSCCTCAVRDDSLPSAFQPAEMGRGEGKSLPFRVRTLKDTHMTSAHIPEAGNKPPLG